MYLKSTTAFVFMRLNTFQQQQIPFSIFMFGCCCWILLGNLFWKIGSFFPFERKRKRYREFSACQVSIIALGTSSFQIKAKGLFSFKSSHSLTVLRFCCGTLFCRAGNLERLKAQRQLCHDMRIVRIEYRNLSSCVSSINMNADK
jgi:hypothetical protein